LIKRGAILGSDFMCGNYHALTAPPARDLHKMLSNPPGNDCWRRRVPARTGEAGAMRIVGETSDIWPMLIAGPMMHGFDGVALGFGTGWGKAAPIGCPRGINDTSATRWILVTPRQQDGNPSPGANRRMRYQSGQWPEDRRHANGFVSLNYQHGKKPTEGRPDGGM